jgi:hypothetical protein
VIESVVEYNVVDKKVVGILMSSEACSSILDGGRQRLGKLKYQKSYLHYCHDVKRLP